MAERVVSGSSPRERATAAAPPTAPTRRAGGTPIRASRPRGRFGRRPRSPRRTSARTRHCRRSRSRRRPTARATRGSPGGRRRTDAPRRVRTVPAAPLQSAASGGTVSPPSAPSTVAPPETPSVQRRASATTASSVDPDDCAERVGDCESRPVADPVGNRFRLKLPARTPPDRVRAQAASSSNRSVRARSSSTKRDGHETTPFGLYNTIAMRMTP